MGKKNKNFAQKRRLNLKKDNLCEDRIIKSLERKLKLKKRTSKGLPKCFASDGLDYLLEVCDEDSRKIAAESEKQLLKNLDNESDDESDFNENSRPKSAQSKKSPAQKGKRKLKAQQLNSQFVSESDNESDDCNNSTNKKSKNKYSDEANDPNFKKKIMNNDKNNEKNNKSKNNKKNKKKVTLSNKKRKLNENKSSDSEEISDSVENELAHSNSSGDESIIDSNVQDEHKESNEEDNIWEDIYGRKRDKDGNVIKDVDQKYITPARRLQALENDSVKNEKLLLLKRQIKGLLNRLAESNMHTIISQFDGLYMSNSRNDMNEMLTNLMLESIVTPVLTAERLVTEHMMCIAILHANIDTQIGANFIMVLIKKFHNMAQITQDVENKELDNLALMISHLYNFKVFGSQLIHQILEKLAEKFTEKEIEIILLILKTAGYRLRKDDPLALKELILNLQQKATAVESSNSRIQFMLDVLLAIKNNNMNKIPQYDSSHIEHLKKVLKTLIRKGNSISQLNFSLEDLLNADHLGKWWIVGSAWSGKSVSQKPTKTVDNKPVYSQKILELAKAQRMNTDVRKNIFCILMSAEDYLDAFEKLHHLGLKDRQEREIIYVILTCCLQEQNFNPYYAVLLQKFCDYDRKYQISIQYALWDKIKMLSSFNSKQVMNLAKLMSYLFIQKGLPISILKVIQLGELDKVTMKLFKKIMLDILLHEDTQTCLQVFERITSAQKLHQFREGLRLFINYFLLKNIKKDTVPQEQMQLLEKRITLVDKLLTTSTTRIIF